MKRNWNKTTAKTNPFVADSKKCTHRFFSAWCQSGIVIYKIKSSSKRSWAGHNGWMADGRCRGSFHFQLENQFLAHSVVLRKLVFCGYICFPPQRLGIAHFDSNNFHGAFARAFTFRDNFLHVFGWRWLETVSINTLECPNGFRSLNLRWKGIEV